MADKLHQTLIQREDNAAKTLTDNSYQEFLFHWTGKVIQNDDPLHLGRVKILINGYYNDISESAIPWALPEFSYLGSSKGSFTVPEIGTIVRGYFDKR